MNPIIFTDMNEQDRLLVNLPNTLMIYLNDWDNIRMSGSLDNTEDNGVRRLGFFGAKLNPSQVKSMIKFAEIPGSYLDVLPTYVEMLKRLKKYFNTPKTLTAHDIHHYVRLMDDKKRYIIKVKDQARGVGKHFVTKDELRRMILETAYIDEKLYSDHKKFIEKYKIDPGIVRSELEEKVLHEAIRTLSTDWLILQEEVKFTHELRILMFKDVFKNDKPALIAEKREGYKPGSKEERKHEVIDFDKFILNEFKSETLLMDIYERLSDFNKDMSHCAVSMDLWISEDELKGSHGYNPNCWGVFEYSNEFGIDYPTDVLSKISDFYSLGLLNLLEIDDCEDKEILRRKIHG